MRQGLDYSLEIHPAHANALRGMGLDPAHYFLSTMETDGQFGRLTSIAVYLAARSFAQTEQIAQLEREKAALAIFNTTTAASAAETLLEVAESAGQAVKLATEWAAWYKAKVPAPAPPVLGTSAEITGPTE